MGAGKDAVDTLGGRCHSCLAVLGEAARGGPCSPLTFSKPLSLPLSDRQHVNRTCLSEGRSSRNAIINHREAVVNYYHKTITHFFYSPRSAVLKGLGVPGLSIDRSLVFP